MMKAEFLRLIACAERLTGRRYPQLRVLLDSVPEDRLTRELFDEFRRLTHDLEQEVSSAKRQGNRDAWQRGRIY
jgi:hypothetical protein